MAIYYRDLLDDKGNTILGDDGSPIQQQVLTEEHADQCIRDILRDVNREGNRRQLKECGIILVISAIITALLYVVGILP